MTSREASSATKSSSKRCKASPKPRMISTSIAAQMIRRCVLCFDNRLEIWVEKNSNTFTILKNIIFLN